MPHTLKLDATQSGAIEHAANLLRRGQLVALPTETVYGLAGDAANPRAVKKIFEAKQRPLDGRSRQTQAGMFEIGE